MRAKSLVWKESEYGAAMCYGESGTGQVLVQNITRLLKGSRPDQLSGGSCTETFAAGQCRF